MSPKLSVDPALKPVLDPDFMPAVLWNRAFVAAAEAAGAVPLRVAVGRADGTVSTCDTVLFADTPDTRPLNERYVERLVKALLWLKGGCRVTIAGDAAVAASIAATYSAAGKRSFDYDIMGEKIYGRPMEVVSCPYAAAPVANETAAGLGRNLDGCRIGFDLGGSDRKAAAVIDGEVVFSEEIAWDPYFQKDPQYHYDGIQDSLKRAAAHLPRVDAIGGSAAGVYVNNLVRVASLFRGVPDDAFKTDVQDMFLRIKAEWGGIPFEVVNDGEVTALAGAMSLNENAVLGVAMGTSEAAGYANPDGNITNWLNELAFVPVDYRLDAPVDEWSGDAGCGVQYFSQQAVGRLHAAAGIELPDDLPLPEKLVKVQELMAAGDERAAQIYATIGVYFGYAIAHYADFYTIRNLLIMGRVTSGAGGELIIKRAGDVLQQEFPELHKQITMRTPSEKDKRHGQAIAAASLPALNA